MIWLFIEDLRPSISGHPHAFGCHRLLRDVREVGQSQLAPVLVRNLRDALDHVAGMNLPRD